jgi:DNA-binding MarR family transcriptional regulator
MHRSDDTLGRTLLELANFINDPRQDWRMMAEAGLDLDPVFLPLLVGLGAWGPAGVVELSGRLGRDHSTISRQIDRLEGAGLVARAVSPKDGRVRIAQVTPAGEAAVAKLSAARRRLLDRAFEGWPAGDRETLTRLLGRFAESLRATLKSPP